MSIIKDIQSSEPAILSHILSLLHIKDLYNFSYTNIENYNLIKKPIQNINTQQIIKIPILLHVFPDCNNTKYSFSVRDNNYLSARWPGDAYHFSFEFLKLIK